MPNAHLATIIKTYSEEPIKDDTKTTSHPNNDNNTNARSLPKKALLPSQQKPALVLHHSVREVASDDVVLAGYESQGQYFLGGKMHQQRKTGVVVGGGVVGGVVVDDVVVVAVVAVEAAVAVVAVDVGLAGGSAAAFIILIVCSCCQLITMIRQQGMHSRWQR